jgi:zinc-finger of transposase IS204/IS1001/IS1096/IS1165
LPPQRVTCPACELPVSGPSAGEGAEFGDLLSHLSEVIVDKVECTPSAVVCRARWRPAQAACPACGTWSSRVHGSYVRLVRDLPLGGRPVLIHLTVRRFRCPNPACTKVTFAGQAKGLTARYQRWSVPLAGLLSQIALELAGRAGQRLARALGVAVHRGTLQRLTSDVTSGQACLRTPAGRVSGSRTPGKRRLMRPVRRVRLQRRRPARPRLAYQIAVQ